jgi:SH3-like domain-containing protein
MGTKIQILEEVQNWIRIELADGRQGWMQSPDVEII